MKFRSGSNTIHAHVDAVHAAPPRHDKYAGQIADAIAKMAGCSVIVATVSRDIADLNRPPNESNQEAIKEYRRAIRLILEHLGNLDVNGKAARPYLHLAIHGMADTGDGDIEIGTRFGETCSENIKDWLVNRIDSWGEEVQVDRRFPGNPSKSFHRCGDSRSDLEYLGYGDNFNTFQVEIGRTLREKYRRKLINRFAEIVVDFNDTFDSATTRQDAD
ncbi:MAG: hypothetical protein KAR39_06810 [Thermoplasmata archaeon]|nr:hypothetical protein [Thermoplasmata archaeon]